MVADADRAADITQDTFIKAYRKLDTLTDATSTRSWLYRMRPTVRHIGPFERIEPGMTAGHLAAGQPDPNRAVWVARAL